MNNYFLFLDMLSDMDCNCGCLAFCESRHDVTPLHEDAKVKNNSETPKNLKTNLVGAKRRFYVIRGYDVETTLFYFASS